MPAKNESQKRLMCMAMGVKSGKMDAMTIPAKYRKGVQSAADSMTMQQLQDMCPPDKTGA